MLGLIKKDLLIIKENRKLLLIFLVIFGFMGLEGENIFYFAPVFISTMIFMSTFSYDEYNKWDAYAVTLPKGRKNVVRAKYIANILIVITTILLTELALFITGVVNPKINITELQEEIFGITCAAIVLQIITYPLIFKFGIEKGRIGIAGGVFITATLFGILFQNLKIEINPTILQVLNDYGVILFLVLCLILLYVSYKISTKIYIKKEF